MWFLASWLVGHPWFTTIAEHYYCWVTLTSSDNTYLCRGSLTPGCHSNRLCKCTDDNRWMLGLPGGRNRPGIGRILHNLCRWRTRSVQCFFNPGKPGKDDDDPPASCGGLGGAMHPRPSLLSTLSPEQLHRNPPAVLVQTPSQSFNWSDSHSFTSAINDQIEVSLTGVVYFQTLGLGWDGTHALQRYFQRRWRYTNHSQHSNVRPT